MRFFETLSIEGDSRDLLEDLTGRIASGNGEPKPDLGFLFLSAAHRPDAPFLLERIAARTGVRHLLGCTADSIVGEGREVERTPGASLWLASLPGVDVTPFEVACEQTPDGFCFPVTPPAVFDATGENAAAILLGEPFTMPVDQFVRRFNEDCPGVPMIGGMASGGVSPGENLLFLDGEIRETGAVGVLLGGPLVVRALVSQGCRPIGRRLVVTDCDRNTVKTLGGRPALKVIQEMFCEVSPEERGLFQAAPHIGIVMNEQKSCFGPGDFLIRNLLGVDPTRGAVFISDRVRRGQTVQFHVRDGAAASEDLRVLLEQDRRLNDDRKPLGGLVFCCNGRGQRLFERPDHDIGALREAYGPVPLSGLFAQGELGPVGGKNHLHGFTTCVALFCEP